MGLKTFNFNRIDDSVGKTLRTVTQGRANSHALLSEFHLGSTSCLVLFTNGEHSSVLRISTVRKLI